MSNFTFEDYRKAIKAKYEKEIEGDYSNNLSSPTTANLRNLCIKRFTSNTNKEDLITFESFFDFPFDKDKKNLFGEEELNKLEAVKRFFLGKTEKPAEDTIRLAAILVDLQPRPFNEFKKKIDKEDLELINELRLTNFDKDISSDILRDQLEIETLNDSTTDFVREKPELFKSQEAEPIPNILSTFVTVGNKSIFKRVRYAVIITILFGLCLIIYLALRQKECMQWSGDHYEIVDCNFKGEGLITANPVEVLDKNLVGLKKVKICDTTVYFDKNHNAIIWYAKRGNGVDFFNSHGRHPENNSPLKPVTKYILDKYINNKKQE
ncbi:hypothetical protein IR010_12630 [Flavobacterium sp. MR2016-29]|uniref:hypothetical protein n=1 Tax=Flavobacterium sp. MR2016-29 TaxID=2783795 RepID=UPI00188AA535|nr:hypothetical protein [Flavobacterium sp. MR2016-29]MBF4493387.1 hypothetical protein [Flavobacterium sp. MR2016-29]